MTPSNYVQPRRELTEETIKILLGETESNAFNCQGKAVVGLSIPSVLTGNNLTLLSSFTLAGTFKPVHDIFGNKVTIVAGVDTNIEANGFLGNKFYKLVSDATELAERVIPVTLIGI